MAGVRLPVIGRWGLVLGVVGFSLLAILLPRHVESAGPTPVNLTCVDQGYADMSPGISPNGTELFKGASLPGEADIYVSQAQAGSCPWTAPVAVASLNAGLADQAPDLTGDGLTIYFQSNRTNINKPDIYVATRPAKSPADNWSTPVLISEISHATAATDSPSVSFDNLTLYFSSDRPGGAGGYDIWVSARPNTSSAWSAPVLVTELNSSYDDDDPDISADGLKIFFMSDRPGGCGGRDLWVASRAVPSGPFGAPTNLGCKINSAAHDLEPSIGADGVTLYFESDRREGGTIGDIWVVTLEEQPAPTATPTPTPVVLGGSGEYPDLPAGRNSGGLAGIAAAVAAGAVALGGAAWWARRSVRP